jgi:hypothetical protein
MKRKAPMEELRERVAKPAKPAAEHEPMWKLPLDVRQMVWEHVVYNSVVCNHCGKTEEAWVNELSYTTDGLPDPWANCPKAGYYTEPPGPGLPLRQKDHYWSYMRVKVPWQCEKLNIY